MPADKIQFGSAILAVVGVSWVLSAPGEPSKVVIWTDRASFLPKNRFFPLPGKVTGILLRNPAEALAIEGRSSQDDQFWFSTDGSSYQSLFVPVTKNPIFSQLEASVGSQGERQMFHNLSFATRETLRPLGIDSDIALVELEVNGGKGSPAADSLIATQLRRLDGTRDFPAMLPRLRSKVAQMYQDWISSDRRFIDAALEDAATKTLGPARATGPREQTDVFFVTWLSREGKCRVHIRTTITNGAYEYEGGIRIEFTPTTEKKPSASLPASQSTSLRYGRQFGVEFGSGYDISRNGSVEQVVHLPIETFQRDIRPRGILMPPPRPPRKNP
jgi:hypothetical protein